MLQSILMRRKSLARPFYCCLILSSGKLGAHENRRFALSLIADKSSEHHFRVVLDLADGTTAASDEISLLYFLPRIGYTQ